MLFGFVFFPVDDPSFQTQIKDIAVVVVGGDLLEPAAPQDVKPAVAYRQPPKLSPLYADDNGSGAAAAAEAFIDLSVDALGGLGYEPGEAPLKAGLKKLGEALCREPL